MVDTTHLDSIGLDLAAAQGSAGNEPVKAACAESFALDVDSVLPAGFSAVEKRCSIQCCVHSNPMAPINTHVPIVTTKSALMHSIERSGKKKVVVANKRHPSRPKTKAESRNGVASAASSLSHPAINPGGAPR
ncbi:hypothetical protein AB0305_00510 [Arthrobacter sp. NPDC080086]|uniref:hypothetical protein n=1 Tax=Arthrobacter sp. NPDC080086 TaxID=3155917 RepID=UPI00344BC070